jgi:GTPase SAR1 family protein
MKKGKAAVDIYRKALRKGKQKIPRCNLLILGEERTGKTSLYRLLVGKGFNPNQDSTKGIDNTVVETVDVRHVASDTWEEKTVEDQKKQSEDLFALGVVKEVKKELQFEEEEDCKVTFLCSSKKLMDAVRRSERILDDIKHESHHQHRPKFDQQSQQHKPHTGLKEVFPATPTVPYKSTPQSYTGSVSQPPTKQDAGSITVRDTGLTQHTSDTQNPVEQELALTIAPKKVNSDHELPMLNSTKTVEPKPKPTDRLAVVQLSRRHSKEISKLIKSQGLDKELALTYNTLDFAGQKEYHPMHHCFITRRALNLVVFNLQKMIKYIAKKEPIAESPLEQIRYWLHSIHAHVFPPKEDDHMRRVCLVGTHRAPKQSKDGEEITEEQMKQIDNELRTLERDERCVSHLHYTSNPE